MTPEELDRKIATLKSCLDMVSHVRQHIEERTVAITAELEALQNLRESLQNFPDPTFNDINALIELQGYGVDTDLLMQKVKPSELYDVLKKIRHIHVKYNVISDDEVEKATMDDVDRFSENLAAVEPRTHALFTMLDLDQKLLFIRAYKQDDKGTIRRLLHIENSA